MLLVVFQIGYTFAESVARSVAVVFVVWCAVMFAGSAAVWWSAAFVCSSPRESSAAAELIGVPSTGVIVIVAGVLGDMFGVHAAGKGPYTLPRLCQGSPAAINTPLK